MCLDRLASLLVCTQGGENSEVTLRITDEVQVIEVSTVWVLVVGETAVLPIILFLEIKFAHHSHSGIEVTVFLVFFRVELVPTDSNCLHNNPVLFQQLLELSIDHLFI